ncbi:RWD domain-containing protein 3-like isoform X2 [Glandiceps talaboti]
MNDRERESGNTEYSFSICIMCKRCAADTSGEGGRSYAADTSGQGGKRCATHSGQGDDEDNLKVTLTYILRGEYPSTLPTISVNCQALNRQQTTHLRTDLLDYAESLRNEYMILDLTMWVSQHIWDYVTRCSDPNQTSTSNEEPTWISILHIDHMRAQQKYIKIITSWVAELKLTGTLLLQGHLILLILQGQQSDLKEYMVRHRTQKVDVDSNGRSCKEKMMSVLCELALPSSVTRCQDFQVRKLDSKEDLETIFQDMQLEDLYKKYVVMLCHSKK